MASMRFGIIHAFILSKRIRINICRHSVRLYEQMNETKIIWNKMNKKYYYYINTRPIYTFESIWLNECVAHFIKFRKTKFANSKKNSSFSSYGVNGIIKICIFAKIAKKRRKICKRIVCVCARCARIQYKRIASHFVSFTYHLTFVDCNSSFFSVEFFFCCTQKARTFLFFFIFCSTK